MLRSPRLSTLFLRSGLALSILLGSACDPVTDPPVDGTGGQLAKAATGPTVTSVNPSYGHQADGLVTIRVLGSGYDQGSVASWERNGVADPKITVHETRFVSSGELSATVSIAADASIDLYDVAVTTSTRKKGIGMEKYEVTAAQSIGTLGGNTLSRSINDLGQVVGYSMAGSSQRAFFWQAGQPMVNLGSGQAYDVDPTGTVAVGISSPGGVVWRFDGSSWASSALPNAAGARPAGIARVNDALVIAGQSNVLVGRKTVGRTTTWTSSGTDWTLEVLNNPSGYESSWAEDVSPTGHVTGSARAGSLPSRAVLWNPDESTVLLPPLSGDATTFAYGISPNATIVAGQSGSRAVVWMQNEAGTWTPRQLDTCGNAQAVNDAGMVVGQGCNGATMWQLDANGTVVSQRRLPGLGSATDPRAVEGINNSATPTAAGAAKSPNSPSDEGVIWDLAGLTTQ
jgi:probable HAF family extracellular repeat protein